MAHAVSPTIAILPLPLHTNNRACDRDDHQSLKRPQKRSRKKLTAMDHYSHRPVAFEPSVDDFSASKVDYYGFDSLLGHDASLTHGLDTLGTCNNTENACLDQRCFDHYGKSTARRKTLDIGLDIASDADAGQPHLSAHTDKTQPHDTKSKSLSRSAAEMSSTTLHNPHGESQKRKRLHEQTYHAQSMPPPQNPIYQAQQYPSIHHVSISHQVEPMAALQSLNETIQHNHNFSLNSNIHSSLNDFQVAHSAFSMPSSPQTRWSQSAVPSWTNLLQQSPVGNYFPIFSPNHLTYDDAASVACSSACNDVKCWSQCGDAADPNCCFDASCADLDFSDACCFEPDCTIQEPCLDASCQEASIPCHDANCVGTTPSTTPTSVSVMTPSVEPEPAADTTRSPMKQSHSASFDISQGLGHGLGHDFSATLCPSFAQALNTNIDRHLSHDHSPIQNHETEQNSLFVVPRSVTPKTEVADTKSVSEETQLTCRWLCGNGLPCGQTFLSNKELQDHCKNEHVKTLKKIDNTFCCNWDACHRPGPFSQKSKLERHLQTHTGFKPVKCAICGISLSAKQSLEQHMRTHSGEKPWVCTHPGCSQRFKQQSALTMHLRTHTGEKPLQCEICGKRFGESSNLSKHRRTHNVRGNHVCELCGKDFHRLDQLRRHMSVHRADGEKRSKDSTPI